MVREMAVQRQEELRVRTEERDSTRAPEREAVEEANRMRRDAQAARFEAGVLGGQQDEQSNAVRERSTQGLSENIDLTREEA